MDDNNMIKEQLLASMLEYEKYNKLIKYIDTLTVYTATLDPDRKYVKTTKKEIAQIKSALPILNSLVRDVNKSSRTQCLKDALIERLTTMIDAYNRVLEHNVDTPKAKPSIYAPLYKLWNIKED
jgi:uncharacterized membrane protein YgaE (UPF0421/DUF939 family)